MISLKKPKEGANTTEVSSKQETQDLIVDINNNPYFMCVCLFFLEKSSPMHWLSKRIILDLL